MPLTINGAKINCTPLEAKTIRMLYACARTMAKMERQPGGSTPSATPEEAASAYQNAARLALHFLTSEGTGLACRLFAQSMPTLAELVENLAFENAGAEGLAPETKDVLARVSAVS